MRDLVENPVKLPEGSVDYVMLFNILHHDEPEVFLKESMRILNIGGKVGVIHWNYDPKTPRGPSMDIRPKPEFLVTLLESQGFFINCE